LITQPINALGQAVSSERVSCRNVPRFPLNLQGKTKKLKKSIKYIHHGLSERRDQTRTYNILVQPQSLHDFHARQSFPQVHLVCEDKERQLTRLDAGMLQQPAISNDQRLTKILKMYQLEANNTQGLLATVFIDD
jgi:hypothetical protein